MKYGSEKRRAIIFICLYSENFKEGKKKKEGGHLNTQHCTHSLYLPRGGDPPSGSSSEK
jgi:hypothetical protein